MNRINLSLLASVLLLAFFFRFYGLSERGLWHDEVYTIGNLVGFDLYLFPGSDLSSTEFARPAGDYVDKLTKDYFAVNLWRNLVHEGHPPLYLLSAKAWSKIFGSTEHSVRLFSVLISTLVVLLIFFLGKKIGGYKTGIYAMVLLAASPFQVYFSTEARNYSLTTLFAVIATISAIELRAATKPKAQHWLTWILFATAACYTHYYAVLYCLLLIAFFLLPAAVSKKNGLNVKRLFLTISPLLVFSFWLPVLYLQLSTHEEGVGHFTQGGIGLWASIKHALLGFIELIFGPFYSLNHFETIFFSCCLVLSFLAVFFITRKEKLTTVFLFLCIVPAHALLVMLLDATLNHHTISIARYSACLSIPLIILLAWSLDRLQVGGAALMFAVVLTISNISMEISTGERAARQMLRETASFINQHMKPGDIVVVTPSGPTLVGLSLYLNPNIPVAGVPASQLRAFVNVNKDSREQTIWSVQQRLGLEYESWAEPSTPKSADLIRFAGVDLAKY